MDWLTVGAFIAGAAVAFGALQMQVRALKEHIAEHKRDCIEQAREIKQDAKEEITELRRRLDRRINGSQDTQ